MEPAVYFSAPHAATVPSRLVTSFVGRANVPMDGRARSDVFNDQLSLLQVRDAVTLSGPVVFIDETTATFLPSGWITVIDTPSKSNSQETAPVSSILQISIPVLATPEEPVQTSMTPIITRNPIPDAVPQLGAEPVPSDPINPCNINTAPLDQQRASYQDCQRTMTLGGVCCLPYVPHTSIIPSTTAPTTATTPASAPASPTNPPPSSIVEPTSHTAPTKSPASSTFSTRFSSPPSTAPASPTSAPAPMPTEVVPRKRKTPILPILIPCSLAAVGIVALGIWCTVWRSREQRHRPPPSVDMAPKMVNGQKVFKAGNFAGAEGFERGVEEMGRKEKVNEEGMGRWKSGYRKYRESGTGSGLLGKKA